MDLENEVGSAPLSTEPHLEPGLPVAIGPAQITAPGATQAAVKDVAHLLDSSPFPLLIISTDGECRGNKAARVLLKLPVGSFPLSTLTTLWGEKLSTVVQGWLRTSSQADLSGSAVRMNLPAFPGTVRIEPAWAPDAAFLFCSLTREKSAEPARSEAQPDWHESLSHLISQDPAAILDPVTGQILDANPAFGQSLEFSPEQLRLLSWEQIETLLEGQPGLVARCQSWPMGEIHKGETILRDSRGQSRHFATRASLAAGPGRKWLIWTGIESTHLVSQNQGLRDREMVFSTIIGQALDGVALIDLSTGKFSAFNEAAHRGLGYDQEEFSRMRLPDLSPVNAPGTPAAPGVLETVQKRKDGSIRHARVSNRQIAIGGKDFLVSIWTDISERKWAEKVIKESENRFAAAFDKALIGMALISPTGRFLRVNPALEAILGYSEKELLDRTWDEFTHPEEPRRDLTSLKPGIPGEGDALRRFQRYLNKSGNVVWVDLLVQAIRPGGEGQGFFIGQFMDLTDLKRSRDMLGQSERRFLNAFEFAAVGQALISLEGRWIKVNPAMIEMLGYEEEILLGADIDLHGAPRDGGTTLDRLRDLISAEAKSAKYLKFYRHRRGQSLWISESVSLVRTDEGEPLHFVAQLVDMTPQMETMDALRKSEAGERAKRAELQTLFELTPTPIWVADDPNCERVTGNRAAYELFQQPFGTNLSHTNPRFANGAHFSFYRDGRPLPLEELPLRKVIRTGQRWEFGELELRLSAGITRHILGRAEPLTGPDGKIVGAIAAVVDITELKRSESALRESEERWKFALEGSEEGVWDWNIKTGETRYSRRWKEMLGFQDDEIEDRFEEWSNRVYPADLPRALQAKQDYFEGRTKQFSNEHRMMTKQGQWQWRLTRGKVVSWDEAGKPIRMIGTHVDITKRKLAEFQKEFHAAIMAKIATGTKLEEAALLIVESVERQFPDMICSVMILDPGDRCLYPLAGPAFPEGFRKILHGLKIGPMVGSCGAATFLGKRVIAADVLTHPNWTEFVDLAKTYDFRACWSEPILGADNLVLGSLAVYHRSVHHPTDTELEVLEACARMAGVAIQKKQAEDLLAANQRLLSEAEHLSLTGGWMWESKRGVCVGSSGWQKLLGTHRREIEGMPLATFTQAEDLAALTQAWNRLLGGGGPLELEIRIQRESDRAIRWIALRGVLVQKPDQEDLVYGAAQDITQLKQSREALARREKELTRSNADLQQFSYAASHDLQEPLRMISNFTQLLEKRYSKEWDDKAQKYFQFIQDGCIRMKRLMDDLLEYARVGVRNQPAEMVSLGQVVEECLKGMGALLSEQGATVERGELPRVPGHRSSLVQLFSNLLANSVKFRGHQPPRIRISAESSGEFWQIAVEDHGIGIPEEFRERVFALFQRLHTRDEYPGTGIGLALCKKIIERHGGKIWVETPSWGHGVRIAFLLPRHSPIPPSDPLT